MQRSHEDQLELALQSCESEPIHNIGSIQPHGTLLTLDNDGCILHVSSNSFEVIEVHPATLLGKNINEFKILSQLASFLNLDIKTTLRHIFQPDDCNAFEVTFSKNASLTTVELVPKQNLAEDKFDFGYIIEDLFKIQKDSIGEYFDVTSRFVQQVSGYDRVMVYRFDSNWDGEVISEYSNTLETEYLGARFPASDIPAQARQLYLKNPVRYVFDINATPASIISTEKSAPLDLTYVGLRSLSAVHLQYLKNMGVESSLSISLIQGDRLWGLITCHNRTPKYLDSKHIRACELIGKVASERLNAESTKEQYLLDDKVIHLFGLLSKFIWQSEIPNQVLEGLQSLMNADGVVLALEHRLHRRGFVPENSELIDLIKWLIHQNGQGVYVCDDLSSHFEKAQQYKNIASGILATPFPLRNGNYVIWFRKEAVRTIHWAGKPHKDLIVDEKGKSKLMPRNSFSLWAQMWHGHSRPWLPAEIISAKRFGAALLNYIDNSLKTERSEKERNALSIQLAKTQELMGSIVKHIPAIVTVKDANHLKFEIFNPTGLALLGFAEEDVIGKTNFDLFPVNEAAAFTESDLVALRTGTIVELPAESTTTANGQKRDFFVRKVAIRDRDEHPTHLLSVAIDVTERRAAEQEITKLAFYDALTGLPNRRLMLDRLNQALASCARSQRHMAFLLIDLDEFKKINDVYGHSTGDAFLKEVACRLVRCTREEDTVSRLGGDEFVIILGDLSEIERHAVRDVEGITFQIFNELKTNFYIKTRSDDGNEHLLEHACYCSIGVSLLRGKNHSAEEIIKHADTAMYEAKNAGRNAVRFFDPKMQESLNERLEMERLLRLAIINGEFILNLQPQMNKMGELLGAEILLRWRHPQHGVILPDKFITLAEETGLILPIGFWVMEQTCSLLGKWSEDINFSKLTLSVNASARQFCFPSFEKEVSDLMEAYKTPPSNLMIEITESTLLQNIEMAATRVASFRRMNVRISIDDFGTGFSSLSHLKNLALDQIKIDKSFIKDIATAHKDINIVSAVVALAKNLDIAVIAEGVETKEQVHILDKIGCYTYQGFLFGKPMSVAEFEYFAKSLRSNSKL